MADYPGVNCAACHEALGMDGLTPGCETASGCLIPPLGDAGRRVIEVRRLLVDLHPLVDAGTICRTCNVDRTDLELLAVAETELRQQAKDNPDG